MPVSKKRKTKDKRAVWRGPARPGYQPTVLTSSAKEALEADVVERLWRMPAERLPSFGLAEWFLATSPLEVSNHCVATSVVITLVMESLGLPAEPVALLLDVPAPGGGRTRYGNSSPHMDGPRAVGHVGVVGDDVFLDPTAYQFPEIVRHGGVRVLGGALGVPAEEVFRRGAVVPTRLVDGHVVEYQILPAGLEAPLVRGLLEANSDEVTHAANNLLIHYTKALSLPETIDKVHTLTQPRYTRFVAAVTAMQGRTIETGPDNRLRAVPAQTH